MNNKLWKKLYEEIIQKIERINTTQKKEIENQTENINIMINNIQTLKDELVQQLENQGVKDIDKNAKFSELIKMIGKIEGGGGASCEGTNGEEYLSFNTSLISPIGGNIEVLEPDKWLKIPSSYELENVTGSLPPFGKIKSIKGFDKAKFTGEFPLLPDIVGVGGDYGFGESEFSGKFPLLPNLEEIYHEAFYNSEFTGEFPALPRIEFIYNEAFYNSKFTEKLPVLPLLQFIDDRIFYHSEFTGEFPVLSNLRYIGQEAFYNSKFTGELPILEELSDIYSNAFYNSNFDKDEDGFVKNYPGWDGKSEWRKPLSYRAAMKDVDAPKLMSIIPPGAGKMQVLNEEAKLAQSIRRDEYLKENEPSDTDYYLSYTKKLKEIGFERDEYGNYIDMINDKSVIIIPEDIKFLV